MKVYSGDELIAEVSSEEEANAVIEELRKKDAEYVNEAQKKVEMINERVSRLRRKADDELNSEYREYVTSRAPDLIRWMEELAKEYFKDKYIDIYIFDSDNASHGIKIIKEDAKGGYMYTSFELIITEMLSSFLKDGKYRIEE